VHVAAVGQAFPPNHYDQETLIAALRGYWAARHHNVDRIEALHRNVLVGGRHLALPLEAYPGLDTFGKANDAWIRVAVEVGEAAARDGLLSAGVLPGEVGAFFSTTVTGVAAPSLDARLLVRLGLPLHAKRVPLFGLGCLAGAAGIARAADYVRAFPGEAALLLSVELCSLTLQRDDFSIPNIVSSGLFGDGAAAVVLTGGARDASQGFAGPRVTATGSVFYRDTERVMGWDIVDTGFKVVLSAKVPDVVREHVRRDVDTFLAAHGLERSRIRHWIAHTGGPKVLKAFEEALELPPGALARSWKSLRETGNLSSAAVLFVLGELLESSDAAKGDHGLLMSMGPGFFSELVLLQW